MEIVFECKSDCCDNELDETKDYEMAYMKCSRCIDIYQRLQDTLHISYVNHEQKIKHEKHLKNVHIYCVIHKLSAQQYGPLIEKYIRQRYNFNKNKSSLCTGDVSKDEKNTEIKVSFGGKNFTDFNYVQIRLSHMIDYYLFTAYYLNDKNLDKNGELFVFRIPKDDLKIIIGIYGQYAHGTRQEHADNKNKTVEHALRPKYGDKCWQDLLRFRIDPELI